MGRDAFCLMFELGFCGCFFVPYCRHLCVFDIFAIFQLKTNNVRAGPQKDQRSFSKMANVMKSFLVFFQGKQNYFGVVPANFKPQIR